jgi:S1-C subfamily serine protease
MKNVPVWLLPFLLALTLAACGKNYSKYQPINTQAIPRAELGVRLKVVRVDDTLRLFNEFKRDDEKVLLVTKVKDNTPASKAGVLPGDLLLKIDGVSVSGMRESVAVMQRKRPGETVNLDLFRRGAPLTLSATLK